MALTAAANGALILTSTEVFGLVVEDGRAVGARLRDAETGRTCTVRARVIVGCTGVWSDDLHRLAGVPSPFRVRASKGVHLLVLRTSIQSETGLILRTEKSVLFVIPWGEHWVVGTTDTPWDLGLDHPAASRADIDYILDRVNAVLRQPISDDDIVGVYVGLRPLLLPTDASGGATERLSRGHQVARPLPNLVSVAGGKYTTYRVMARDAVDVAARDLGRPVPPSVTEHVPLLGAAGLQAVTNRAASIASHSGVPVELVRRMIGRYGDLLEDVLAPVALQPELAQPVPGAPQHVLADILYAVTHEGARHLDDVLGRRTRISVDTSHRGTKSAQAVADLVAPVLGWGPEVVEREVSAYIARVEQEIASQRALNDEQAQTLRSAAPDLRRFAVDQRDRRSSRFPASS